MFQKMVAQNVANLEYFPGNFGGKEALAHLKWMRQGVAVITNGMYELVFSQLVASWPSKFNACASLIPWTAGV